MNKANLTGRLVRSPDTRSTRDGMTITRYTIAVDRRFRREGEPDADFLDVVAFGKAGDFADKYFTKGMKVEVSGRIQTGTYTNKDGVKVKTFDIIVEEQGFAESRQAQKQAPAPAAAQSPPPASDRVAQAERAMEARRNRDEALDGFMNIPDSIEEELPFT